jgi:hypothetical protein
LTFYLLMAVLNVACGWWLLQRPPAVLAAPLLCITVVLAVFNLGVLRQVFWTYVYPHFEHGGPAGPPAFPGYESAPARALLNGENHAPPARHVPGHPR